MLYRDSDRYCARWLYIDGEHQRADWRNYQLLTVRPDAISYFADAATVTILLFFTPFGGPLFEPSVIAVLLLVSALVLDRHSAKGTEDDAPEDTNSNDLQRIGIYTLMALAIFYALAFFVPIVPKQYLPALAAATVGGVVTMDGLFVVQIAVSEAEFFHRFLTNFLVSRLGPFGFFAVGAIGMVYHFAVYGDSPSNLLIIFGAFSSLAWVAWTTGRVSPVILAHVINNAIASGLLSLAAFGIPSPHVAVFGLSPATLALALFTSICIIRAHGGGVRR